jgi:pyruvate dehydrogenase E2 component (dihydrolipoamide acetyltransferase)
MPEFRMPSLGADMDRGTVVEWRVKPGDNVQRGDILAVVETDKSDIEVETFTGGVVDEILVSPGQEVEVGSVLAHLRPAEEVTSARRPDTKPGTDGQQTLSRPRQRRPSTSTRRRPAARAGRQPPTMVLSPVVRQLVQAASLDLAKVTPTGPGGVVTRKDVELALARRGPVPIAPSAEVTSPPVAGPSLRASPRAKRLAAQSGVDLASIVGSGPGGAIIGHDLDQAAKPRPAPPAAVSKPDRRDTAERQQALNTAVANLMARSKREIPHYYLSTTIDMSPTMAWLEEQNSTRLVVRRLLPAVVLLKATARAALRVPTMNGYWIEDGFQPEPAVHLGVAISLRSGALLAPTIPFADQLSVDELMDRLRDLVAHARSGSLRSSEMSPPTLTITNLGEEGVESVLPVIYPPQVAMVGFGRISPRPWADQGMLGVRPVVTASLAADHRVSDGHRGARFLNLIDRLLQEPDQL